MPRDVVSRAIYRVCHDEGLGIEGKDAVHMDITQLGRVVIEEKLTEISDLCRTYLQLDPTLKPIPVYPACGDPFQTEPTQSAVFFLEIIFTFSLQER